MRELARRLRHMPSASSRMVPGRPQPAVLRLALDARARCAEAAHATNRATMHPRNSETDVTPTGKFCTLRLCNGDALWLIATSQQSLLPKLGARAWCLNRLSPMPRSTAEDCSRWLAARTAVP